MEGAGILHFAPADSEMSATQSATLSSFAHASPPISTRFTNLSHQGEEVPARCGSLAALAGPTTSSIIASNCSWGLGG